MNAPAMLPTQKAVHGLRFGEFVALMASLMAVNALGIDMMLPALGLIGAELGITVENHQQLVIAVYIASFGLGQLLYGPLADRYGRRPILLGAMLVYATMSLLAALAHSIELLLVARAFQGLAAASTRVLSVSIIRDCYAGRTMARVMSLTFMVFLAVPVLAPTLGQLVLLVAPWHWIFYGLAAFSLCVALWAHQRLPETLAAADRQSIALGAMRRAAREILGDRYSIGYTLAGACLHGGLLGFLNCSPQIFAHSFGAPQLFTLCFAIIAGMMAGASLLNSRVVERLGSRFVSHGALLGLVLIDLVRVAIVLGGVETASLFTLTYAASFFLFGLTGPNFGAMAMEPMGHIAGTASSLQGFISTMIAAAIGLIIGQSFAGTTLPLALGWLLGSLAALAIIFIAERGRLFRPHHAQPGPPPAQ